MKPLCRGLAPLLMLLVLLPAARAESPIRFGWTEWSDGVFVTELAARLIEDRLDQPVERVRTDIIGQYQGLAAGRIDASLMSWQPRTHAPYLERVGNRIEDLGVLYDGARLGWAVPAYVPAEQVRSLADLRNPAVRERLDGRITGIEVTSGLMRLSSSALVRYEIEDYELQTGTGPSMTATLDQAVREDEWIVVTAWSPHWMFAAHDLRYLEDPLGALGGDEQVHAVARRGFHADHPRVAALLGRMWIPLADLETALLDARRHSVDEAVERYLEAHPRRVDYWVTGRL
ncbi:MAG: glycine betaine ABC transporter substrate-binding protein [Halofilum sp. (in: g-proteobacteria)]|nr:glycine betaine ABC transporter substrate-binding protein [Halofilum sp. (in: g-proteobacteria)]